MTLAHMSTNTLNGFTDIPTHTYTKRPPLLQFGIFVVDAEMLAEKKLYVLTQKVFKFENSTRWNIKIYRFFKRT